MIDKSTLRRFALTAICVALLGQAVYASPAESETADPAAYEAESEAIVTLGTISADVLNVREYGGLEQPVVGKLYLGETVRIGKTSGEWHYIATGRVVGWVHADWVTDIRTMTESELQAQKEITSANADNIVAYAMQYIGKPYRAGGKGPDSFDCSGFVSYVYRNFGMELPASSRSYTSIGTPVTLAEIQVGDIMCYDTAGSGNGACSHVGIYVGNGQVIHASTGRRGIVLDNIYDAYYSKRLIKIVRVL